MTALMQRPTSDHMYGMARSGTRKAKSDLANFSQPKLLVT